MTLEANTEEVVPLSNLGPLFGITDITGNTLNINETGVYQIDYFFQGSSSEAATITFEVFENSNVINGSSIVKTVEANASETFMGSLITKLTDKDEVSLGIKASTGTTMTLSDGTSAYLNIIKISN
ncbi:MAG: hypothetical protein SOT41_03350 [Candidatus Faecisoma sp.]|nr:hypothetical protein [Candidatus Faecisoma sp.]